MYLNSIRDSNYIAIWLRSLLTGLREIANSKDKYKFLKWACDKVWDHMNIYEVKFGRPSPISVQIFKCSRDTSRNKLSCWGSRCFRALKSGVMGANEFDISSALRPRMYIPSYHCEKELRNYAALSTTFRKSRYKSINETYYGFYSMLQGLT